MIELLLIQLLFLTIYIKLFYFFLCINKSIGVINLKFYKSISLVSLFLFSMFFSVYADVKGGLTSAKTEVVDQVKSIVNDVVIPVLAVLLAACLVFAITRAVINYKKHQEVEFGWIILLIVGIILVTTFNTWGWNLIS
jgi:hypothetical protein